MESCNHGNGKFQWRLASDNVRKMTSIQKEIFDCVLCGDLDSIKAHFEREGFAEETQEQDVFGLKDEGGRNALLTACMLERSDILRELVRHGAQVDMQTVRGERATSC